MNEHLGLLHDILADFGLEPESLEIVPSVTEWSKDEFGLEDQTSLRQARIFELTDGRYRIGMAEVLTDEMIESGKMVMLMRGLAPDRVVLLDDDLKYLIHLILHEIAFSVLRTSDQKTRSDWALERVSRYSPT